MRNVLLGSPSVGSVIKKIITIHPDLNTTEIIDIIRKSTRKQADSGIAGEFAQAEVIDEAFALAMARDLAADAAQGKHLPNP